MRAVYLKPMSCTYQTSSPVSKHTIALNFILNSRFEVEDYLFKHSDTAIEFDVVRAKLTMFMGQVRENMRKFTLDGFKMECEL